MRVLSLFSGIAGLDMGLKLALPEARVVAYVERDPYCQQVLKARMADGCLDEAPIFDDVSNFNGYEWRGRADLICGGFPCQDISHAGRRKGIQEGNRSGLWFEFERIIREVGPRFVFVENVSALVNRGLDIVLGSLAELRMSAEWGVFSAADVGAPHLRKRVFLLAHATGVDAEQQGSLESEERQDAGAGSETLADTSHLGHERAGASRRGWCGSPHHNGGVGLAHTGGERLEGDGEGRAAAGAARRGSGAEVGNAFGQCGKRWGEPRDLARAGRASAAEARQWERGGDTADDPESGLPLFPPGPADRDGWAGLLGRSPGIAPALSEEEAERIFRGVPYGFPEGIHRSRRKKRTARLKSLGNAVVPQTAALAWTVLWRRMNDGYRS